MIIHQTPEELVRTLFESVEGTTRPTEDKKIGTYKELNLRQHKAGSNVAKHAWTYDHKIDFENTKVIDKGNLRIRKILESWHTA